MPAKFSLHRGRVRSHSLLALRSLIKKMPAEMSMKVLQALFPESAAAQ